MARQISYGVLVVNERAELLLAHVTGQRQWDIPKGAAEPGETPVEAALREALEETGVALEAARLCELGRFDYTPKKDLHLFATQLASHEVDLASCRCTTLFCDRFGRNRPEVDAFRWARECEVPTLCTPRLATVIAQALPMARAAAMQASLNK